MRKVILLVAVGLAIMLAGHAAHAQQLVGVFYLKPNPPELSCLQVNSKTAPYATVTVRQGILMMI